MSRSISPRRDHSQSTLNKEAPYRGFMTYRQPVGHRGKPEKASQLRLKHRVCIVIASLLLIGAHSGWSKHVSAEKVAAYQAQLQSLAEAHRKADMFHRQLVGLIADHPSDNLSVAIALPGSDVQTYGTHETFDGASTAKFLTAAAYLHETDQGKASLQQNIDGQTAEYWLRAMIVKSDDTAWTELNDYLTHDGLAAYAQSIGFANYNPENNTFTATDMATLLQRLYDGRLLNAANRSLLLGYLSHANYREYIVAAVPENAKVYHKVGYDADTLHDSAVISRGQKYVILVIFSDGKGSYDTAARTQLMRTITRGAVTAYL